MKQGTTQALALDLDVDLALVGTITITIKGEKSKDASILVQKTYPQNTMIYKGKIYLKLTQQDTELFNEKIYIECQINFIDKSVGKTKTVLRAIEPTIFTQIIDDNDANIGTVDMINLSVDEVLVVGGKNGIDGKDGVPGRDGINGKDGVDGKNGAPGVNGLDGIAGVAGVNGVDGVPGKDGTKGDPGKSAYQSAQDGGYTGTEQEYNTIFASIGSINAALNATLEV